MNTEPARIDSIDACLPQTQCTRCGYPSCRVYAAALVRGDADIDQCPPGGEPTVRALANILNVAVKPPNPAFGTHQPRRRAVIDEARCIGCRKCIDACPVDAIVGARKWMHTVITTHCNGCELCLPPCPVDCIDMVAVTSTVADSPWPEYSRAEVGAWRDRSVARMTRLARGRVRMTATEREFNAREKSIRSAPAPETIRSEIAAAVARVRRRRLSAPKRSSDSD